jgi:hypothetical protein
MSFKIGQQVEITGYLNKVKNGDKVSWVSEELNKPLKGIYLGFNVVKSGYWEHYRDWETSSRESNFVTKESITCHMVQILKNGNNRYLKPLYVMEDHIAPIMEESI